MYLRPEERSNKDQAVGDRNADDKELCVLPFLISRFKDGDSERSTGDGSFLEEPPGELDEEAGED